MKASSRRKRSTSAGSKPSPRRSQSSQPAARSGSLLAWGIAAGVVVLAFLIYAPSLGGPFILDDFDLMEAFSAVRAGDQRALLRTGRPVLMLTYVLNHRLAGGFEPFGFHVANVLLHALNAILLWRFLATLFVPGRFDDWVPPPLRTLLTYGVPLLFLTSPIQTESVAYISSRSEVLSTTFYLLALWVFASRLREGKPWVTAILVVALSGAAALTKQDKVTLPFAILLMDYLLLSRTDWRKLKQNLPTYGLFGAGLIAAFFIVIRPVLFAGSAGFGLDWQTYVLTQFRMVFLYLRLLLVPVGLNLDRDITPSHTLWEHFSWLALIAIVALVTIVVRYHRRFPVLAFGATFFFLALASGFYPRLDYAAERWLYLPSIGFFFTALILLYRLAGSARATSLAVIGLAVVYSIGTYQRSTVWASDLRLWQDTAEKSPEKVRPLMWLGRIYIDRGQYALALQALERGEQYVEQGSEEHAHLLNNIGLAHANLKDYESAVAAYRRAIQMIPDEPLFHSHLAWALIRLGRKEEGWQEFAKAFEFVDLQPEPYFLRGQAYFQEGRYREAAADFREAIRLRPGNAAAERNLAAAEEAMRQSGME